jgi:hypothetical protein
MHVQFVKSIKFTRKYHGIWMVFTEEESPGTLVKRAVQTAGVTREAKTKGSCLPRLCRTRVGQVCWRTIVALGDVTPTFAVTVTTHGWFTIGHEDQNVLKVIAEVFEELNRLVKSIVKVGEPFVVY